MKKVLITGISGFIAQHCAAQLLIKGYVVKGSIRNKQKKEEIKKGFIKNKIPINKLEFCNLDLLSDEGWEQAMQECDYVFHIASPYNIKVPNDENKIIKPAVEGTLRALKFAKKARIKKITKTATTTNTAAAATATSPFESPLIAWTSSSQKKNKRTGSNLNSNRSKKMALYQDE